MDYVLLVVGIVCAVIGVIAIMMLLGLKSKIEQADSDNVTKQDLLETSSQLRNQIDQLSNTLKFINENILNTIERELDVIKNELRDGNQNFKSEVKTELLSFKAELKTEVSSLKAEVKNELTSVKSETKEEVSSLKNDLRKEVVTLKDEVKESMNSTATLLQTSQQNNQESINKLIDAKLTAIDENLKKVEHTLEMRLNNIQLSISENLKTIRDENGRKLDEIRGTVDEKLSETLNKRINESFKTVSDQLEQVYKSIGEMQTLANDVGSLKQVLSGVKTRGILGEIQLSSILSEILSKEQYEENINTIPNSSERVEFAIKLPGADGGHVYLPIDSKFPGDRYQAVLDARESGDKAAYEVAKKNLETVLKSEAKDIKTKYVEVPYTTAFGIMFLPFEGLYAEAVNMGMVEVLQRDYNINIAGPSTMAAMLNSLQMGFKTLAIQKRSDEVWKVLGEVKGEFSKFENALESMHKHLDQTAKDLDALRSTRTNAINRKLRTVEIIDVVEENTPTALIENNND